MHDQRSTSESLTPVRSWDVMVRPIPLISLCLMIVNDHVLKHSSRVPGWLTGKLSDVSGLIFFPLLVLSLVQAPGLMMGNTGRRTRWLQLTPQRSIAACVFTGVLFGSAKLWSVVANGLAWIPTQLGIPSRLLADRTDLLALPALFVCHWQVRKALKESETQRG